jgi:hypothetical protein
MPIFRLRLSDLSVENFLAYGQASSLKRTPLPATKNSVVCGPKHPAKYKVVKRDYLPLRAYVNSFFEDFCRDFLPQ